jgi:hypothetical protein
MRIGQSAMKWVGRRRRTRPVLAAAPALLALFVLVAGGTPARAATVGTPIPIPAYLHAVACTVSHTCYAIGRSSSQGRTVLLFTLTDGSVTNEQPLDVTTPLRSLACSAGDFCYAVGGAQASAGPADLVLPLERGVAGRVQAVAGADILMGIACYGAETCYAVGLKQYPSGSTGVVVPIVSGQVGQAVPAPGTESLFDIDCPTADACYALGLSGTGVADEVIVPIVDAQPGAPQATDGAAVLGTIACPTADTCYAGGGFGATANAWSDTASAALVAIVDGQPGPAQPVTGAGWLQAIACPSPRTCYGVGNTAGNQPSLPPPGMPQVPSAVVPIVDGVAGTVIVVEPTQFTVGNVLLSADCPNSTTCYAISRNTVLPIMVDAGEP